MALNTPLTPEIIHQTANDLQAEGIRPTLAALRDRLGGGSFTTIGEAMKSWKQQQQQTAQLEKVVIPANLAERLQIVGADLWETAQTHANDQLAKERETLAHKEALLVAEVEDYKAIVSTLETEQGDLTGQLDQLNAQLETATALTGEQLKQIDELNKANIDQGNKLQTLNEKLTFERDKSASLQEKLDLATASNATLASEKTRLTGELATANANLENAKTANNELKATIGEMKESAKETAQAHNAQLERIREELAQVRQQAQTDQQTATQTITKLTADNGNLLGQLTALKDQLKEQAQHNLEREKALQEKIDQLTAPLDLASDSREPETTPATGKNKGD